MSSRPGAHDDTPTPSVQKPPRLSQPFHVAGTFTAANAAPARMIPEPACWSKPPGPMSFAVDFSTAFTWSCDSDGLVCFSSATTPAAIGVAAEVPLSLVKNPVKCVTEQKSGLFGSSAAGPWLL